MSPPRPGPDSSSVEDADHKTLRWWTLLRGIALFNGLAWMITAATVDTAREPVAIQLGLSLVYVVVCGFRSFLPRIDLERTCMVDSVWSSMVVGRSAATVAEVSFATQVGLFVAMVGAAAGLDWMGMLAPIIIMLLALAQVFCWWSVLTLSHLGHAIEESIWGVTFALVGLAMAFAAPQLDGPLQTLAWTAVPICVLYVLFMVFVDVPMYVRRWRAGDAPPVPIRSVREGLNDAHHRRVVTRAWSVWKPEVAWLTGYFSLAVWGSLGLVHITSTLG